MATAIWVGTTLLTIAGIAYSMLVLMASFVYSQHVRRRRLPEVGSPRGVSFLKPLRGVDAGMYEGLRSHCRQQYAGPIEIIFGVHRSADPAVAEIERLRCEFPSMTIRLVECPALLGASEKVSNLAQMLPHAEYEHIVINDSDILVGRNYVERVMQCFSGANVGLVTTPYIGLLTGRSTLWSRIEGLGISTQFIPGVLTARMMEGGIRFGLGSTLATTRTVLTDIGGLESLANYLADDFELGRRIAAAGFDLELAGECVQTTVPEYKLGDFWTHQMRWARSTRHSRPLGHVGVAVTYGIPWALLNLIATHCTPWAWILLAMAALGRIAVALVVGTSMLGDRQVSRSLWLLPLLDCLALLFWISSYAGNTVVWRGERFKLRNGLITPVS